MEGVETKKVNPYVIPISIVIAGIFVASALLVTNGGTSGGQANAGGSLAAGNNSFGNNLSPGAENMRPIDKDTDHIKGAPNARVFIVEYSDFECPFCSRMHPTLSRIVDEFPDDVAWIYRHFPLSSIHARALSASLASECVAELGGNDAFWEFTDQLFSNQRSLGSPLYTRVALELGIDETSFNECLSSNRHQARIQAERENAISSGGTGTPFSIVVNENGDVFPFSGALSYEQVRQIVEAALQS